MDHPDRPRRHLHSLGTMFALVLQLAGCGGDQAGAPDGEPPGDGDGGWVHDASDGDVDPWADWDPGPRCAAFEDLRDDSLRQALHTAVEGHQALSYDAARLEIFSSLDNAGGEVTCVYTGTRVTTDGIPPNDVMNTEHTWCQSWGADTLPAKSDLFHLFPALSVVNSIRGDRPFGDVIDPSWTQGGSSLGRDPWGRTVFEPRDLHKGDCARAMFYFAVRYEMEIEATMESVLRGWNHLDLPDPRERRRNDDIELIQGKRNPFVDCPEVVNRISDF